MQDHPLGRLPEVVAPAELSPTGVASGITSMLGMPACIWGNFGLESRKRGWSILNFCLARLLR